MDMLSIWIQTSWISERDEMYPHASNCLSLGRCIFFLFDSKILWGTAPHAAFPVF